MYDIIIIGAGPAGLTAAIYALRAGKSALVLDNEGYGGQIKNAHKVENYPAVPGASGAELADSMYGQVTALGGKVRFEKVLEIEEGFVVKTKRHEYEGKCVIAAVGTKNRTLGAAGEEKLIGRGVSYCALCDGALFTGKTVCVVGGGNTALQDAIYLAQICKKVYLIHRRSEFRGDEVLANRVKSLSNVELVLNENVAEISGGNFVEEITLASGRKIAASGIFIAVGKSPENEMYQKFADLDKNGYFAADESCRAKTEGFFVAGDCRAKHVYQLTTAVADGATAATAAVEYCNK